jgi:hypothetical protein
MEETQGAREVAGLLRVDAILAAQAGDPVRGLQAAHAALNAGRSIGDEPTLISSLVRMVCGQISAEAVMRVLAHIDSKTVLPQLAAIQTAYLAELEEPLVLNGLRGERSQMNRFFENLETGKTNLNQLDQSRSTSDPSISFYFVYRGFLPDDHARYLRYMHGFIAVAKLPPHQQYEATGLAEQQIRADREIRYRAPLSQLMAPATLKVIQASLRHRAELLSAATLIACERFRLTRGRWPESLAEIPKDLLPAIPTDPFTGEPMKFAKLPDGITVYSLPPKDMRGLDQKRLTNPLGGTELGWRLYDPQHRGLPSLPKPKPDMPDMPDAP